MSAAKKDKVPFRKEIIRGVALGALLLSGMLLGIALYHSGAAQRAEGAPPVEPPGIAPVAPGLEPPEEIPASLETPAAKLTPHVVPVPSSKKPSRASNPGAQETAEVAVGFHEEEAAAAPAPSPEISATAAPASSSADRAVSAAPQEVPAESPEAVVESPQAKPENRGVRWIKSLGKRLHIGGK